MTSALLKYYHIKEYLTVAVNLLYKQILRIKTILKQILGCLVGNCVVDYRQEKWLTQLKLQLSKT